MLPPELSNHLLKVYNDAMKGKVRFSERAGVNYCYSDDHNRAIIAVGEAALRWGQKEYEKLNI